MLPDIAKSITQGCYLLLVLLQYQVMFVELNPLYIPARRLDSVVDLKVVPGFNQEFQDEVKDADPYVIYTHEAQSDGAAAAVVTEYLVQLAKEANRVPCLRGFVMGAAGSMANGRQGWKLRLMYHVFNLLVSAKGLKVYPYTREKDEKEHGMKRNRATLIAEHRPMLNKMKEGYPPSILASGSVEAGRHDIGRDPEDIHGLQRLRGNEVLILAKELMSNNHGRDIFLVVVGLHGGFRLQSPNRDKSYPTKEGLATFFGIPERFIPHTRMEANIGIIIPGRQMNERFGRDWVKAYKDKDEELREQRVQVINDFIMKRGALLVPPHARGVYSQAIELSTPS